MPSAENPLRFIHISDTHINPDRSYTLNYAKYTPMIGAEALIQAIKALPFQADFILHTGDVAYDPVPEVYPAIKELMSQLDLPIYYLTGNHDDASSIQTILMEKDEAQDYLYYDFEAKGVHFVCLDSNGPHEPKHPSGTVTQEQLDWLNEICSSDDERPLVIAIHHNVLPVNVSWLDTWMKLENSEEFHAIVRQASHRLSGVFFGHIHQNLQVLRDGVLYISSASSWCQFKGLQTPGEKLSLDEFHTLPSFNIVTITDTTTAIRRHSFTVDAADV
jgi:3',5'-cyclic-AMP phosphodiesterase